MKKRFLHRYFFALLSLIALGVLFLIRPGIGMNAFQISTATTIEMLLIIPPVFVLLGLLDVWIPKPVMMKFMGPQTERTSLCPYSWFCYCRTAIRCLSCGCCSESKRCFICEYHDLYWSLVHYQNTHASF